MFEVFTTRTVLSMRGLPVDGSVSFGKSASTSVISFPRSPHPTKTMTSARRAWRGSVPRRSSRYRTPRNDRRPARREGEQHVEHPLPRDERQRGGRRFRTAAECGRAISRPSGARSRPRGTPRAPGRRTSPRGFDGGSPRSPGGPSRGVRCGESPRRRPGRPRGRPRPLPGRRAGNSQRLSRSRGGAESPLPMKSPLFARIACRGSGTDGHTTDPWSPTAAPRERFPDVRGVTARARRPEITLWRRSASFQETAVTRRALAAADRRCRGPFSRILRQACVGGGDSADTTTNLP